jgi:hypothetical protein
MVIHRFNTLSAINEACADLNNKLQVQIIQKELPYFNDDSVYKYGDVYGLKKIDGITDYLLNEVVVSPSDIVKLFDH